jgi:hypothetical protein
LQNIAIQARGYVTFNEIWFHLSIPKGDRDGVKTRRVSNALKALGWVRDGQVRDGPDRPHTFKPKLQSREPGEGE